VAGGDAPSGTVGYCDVRATAYFQLDRYGEAACAFQRALEIAPSAATYGRATLREDGDCVSGHSHAMLPPFEPTRTGRSMLVAERSYVV
jgi:tetratricopeptide (TPR) repeat protein